MEKLLILVFFIGTVLGAQTVRDGITIPARTAPHPWTYWTAARIAQAKAWASATGYKPPVTPVSGPLQPRDAEFACLVLSNSAACTAAVNWATSLSTDACTGAGSDPLRLQGQNIALAYDWTNAQFTSAQLGTLNTTWITCENEQDNNTYDWGLYGAGATEAMPASNYFHGDLANDILFGITMYYDNANAPTEMLDVGMGSYQSGIANGSRMNALESYAGTSTLPALNGYFGNIAGDAYGDPFTEGPGEYGRYAESLSAVWLPTLHTLGRNINSETTAYISSVFDNIYDTIYSSNYGSGCTTQQWEYITWSDDENWTYGCDGASAISHNGYANYSSWSSGSGGAMMGSQYYGDFMQMMVNELNGTNVAAYDRQWLNTVKPAVGPEFAALDPNPTPMSFSKLPLDYCSSATISMICWSNSADWYSTQSERLWIAGNNTDLGGVPHAHAEPGNFQIIRKGIPIVRETPGYSQQIAGLGGVGLVQIDSAFAHNVLLFNGYGPNNNNTQSMQGPATVLRRETQPNYFYQATDYTATYNAKGQEHSNPAVAHYVREIFNFRGIPAVVVVDRATASSSSVPITFLAHCETSPTVTANGVSCIDQGEEAEWTFLAPAQPSIVVVDESANSATCDANACQYRVEATNKNPGNALSYFVTVVQVGNAASFSALSPSLVDSDPGNPAGGTFALSLDSNDSLTLTKGALSSGGSITANRVGNTLATYVEPMNVSSAGPVWAPPGIGAPTKLTGSLNDGAH